MRRIAIIFIILLIPGLLQAKSLSDDATLSVPEHGHEVDWKGSREGLINDGSFEFGTCNTGYSEWICDTDSPCDWIDDLTLYGLWNYDGINVAWLGGRCSTVPACTTSFCQEIEFDSVVLTWHWMAYVDDEVMRVYVTVDGETVFEFWPSASDHLNGYFQHDADVSAYLGGTHELCFAMDNSAHCEEGMNDNYFVDFVELVDPNALPEGGLVEISFSAVRSLY